MSADQKTLDDNSKRRRRGRRAADPTPVQSLEVTDDLEDDDDEARGLSERKGRATPGRRTHEVEAAKSEGNFITRRLRGLGEYFEGVRSEVQKVVWPTRPETWRLTRIVLSVTIAASIVLGIISVMFNELFALGLRAPLVFGTVFVVILGGFVFYLRRNTGRTPTY